MKIVIGTRHWLGSDWTHVDADEFPLYDDDTQTYKGKPEYVCDARKIPLPDHCAELVYSQECLEHFPHKEYFAVLSEWARLVAPGGVLKIEVPDFLLACQQVLEHDTLEMDRAIQQIIFGGQDNKYDFHYVGITHRMLAEDFATLGFEGIEVARGNEVGYLRVTGTRPV